MSLYTLSESEIVEKLLPILRPHFRIYQEVHGRILFQQQRKSPSATGVKIDAILIPEETKIGAIGVEFKKYNREPSNNMGRFFSQAMDYLNSSFLIGPQKVSVIPAYCFVGPVQNATIEGTLGSILTQHNIGVLQYPCYGENKVRFKIGQQNLMEATERELIVYNDKTGKKTGSR